MIGPGKYDAAITLIREHCKLGNEFGILLIVVGPEDNNGFAVQADYETTLMIPEILDDVAATIRKDMGRA
jgi:hypothetical protein